MPSRIAIAALVLLTLPALGRSARASQQDATFHTPEEIRAHGTMPKLLHSVDPDFTEEARHKKISGDVQVYLIVDEQGLPTRLKVVRGLGFGLDEEALKAVAKYRFEPGTYQGKPVSVPLYIEVNFQRF